MLGLHNETDIRIEILRTQISTQNCAKIKLINENKSTTNQTYTMHQDEHHERAKSLATSKRSSGVRELLVQDFFLYGNEPLS